MTHKTSKASDQRPDFRLFGRAQGKPLSARQQALVDDVLPRINLPAEGEIDPAKLLPEQASHVLEIGFGGGEHLAGQAAANPDIGYIGIEPFLNGVAKALTYREEKGLQNLRLHRGDAREVLPSFKTASLERVFLLFPDPWHKKKHNKRRIVQPEFVQLVREKLTTNGLFHMATDWEHYAEQMLEVMEEAPGFENAVGEQQYAERPDYRPLTKFEKRGERLGHGVWDLLYSKID